MDSISQALLGSASVGSVGAHKIGNKALIRGIILGTVPDLDVFIGPLFFDNPIQAEIFHRSISHSFFFWFLAAPIFGYIITYFYRKIRKTDTDTSQGQTLISFKFRSLVSFVAFSTHAILDVLTGYGTQILRPITDYRFAIDSVFIVDPGYTIPLLICLLIAFFVRSKNKKRLRTIIGLFLSSIYLLRGLGFQAYVGNIMKQSLQTISTKTTTIQAQENEVDLKVPDLIKAAPTPLNSFLRKGIASDEKNYYQGRYSIFDTDEDITRHETPHNLHLLDEIPANEDIETLIQRRRHITIEKVSETEYILNIMSMGKMMARDDYENAGFLFKYLVTIDPETNTSSVIQSRDFARSPLQQGWFGKLIQRIKGEK